VIGGACGDIGRACGCAGARVKLLRLLRERIGIAAVWVNVRACRVGRACGGMLVSHACVTCLCHMLVSHACVTCLCHMLVSHACVTCLCHTLVSHACVTCLCHMLVSHARVKCACYHAEFAGGEGSSIVGDVCDVLKGLEGNVGGGARGFVSRGKVVVRGARW